MEKQVVLITGASRGIGAAIAKKMAQNKYNIVLNYLTNEQKAIQLKEELETLYSIKVLTVQADISKEEDINRMVKKIIDTFGSITCLVNNAAICMDNDWQKKTPEEFQRVLNVNLVGTFLLSKIVGKIMYEQQFGRIINISSTNGIDTVENYSMDYDASKAGVISLTHNFAKALAPFVLVNAIAPGWTNTEAVLQMNPTYLQEEAQKCLLHRFATPEEIANVVAFLASKDASYINDAIIRVDGGKK